MKALARAAGRRADGGDFVAFSSGRTEMVEVVSARHAGCLRQAQGLARGQPGAERPQRWWAAAWRSVLSVRSH